VVEVPPATSEAVTPEPLTAIPVGFVRLVPVMTTDTVWPCSPEDGAKELIVGCAASTVNGTVRF
jgi:hypothetical protein